MRSRMLFRRDYQRPFWAGFIHALAVVLYSAFLALLLLSLDLLFGSDLGPVFRLSFDIFLVILSLVVLGAVIFFEPMRLAIRHHMKAAWVMMASTLGWLLVFLAIFLIGLVKSLGDTGILLAPWAL